MMYEFVIKKGREEITKEKGETTLEEFTRKVDDIITKMK